METATKGVIGNHPVFVSLNDVVLQAMLDIPAGAAGIVLLAHHVWSGHTSPNSQALAGFLGTNRLATLSVDLLTYEEDRALRLKINTGLLTERLTGVANWVRRQDQTEHLPIGLYVSSLAGVAGFNTAAANPGLIGAIVSRGAYLYGAEPVLDRVTCPTLLVIGESDHPLVVASNREAYAGLKCLKRLSMVPGASNFFNSTQAVQKAANLASDWFAYHLSEDCGERRAA
jgi:putative phosphoribosyl transferase